MGGRSGGAGGQEQRWCRGAGRPRRLDRLPAAGIGRDPVGVGVTAPARATARADPLRDFYEDPAVPARSGPDRAHRQADMLDQILPGAPPPPLILDLGPAARSTTTP